MENERSWGKTGLMINIVVVGDGQTEETLIKQVLVPQFAPDSIFLEARLIETGPGGRGGALAFV